MFEFLSHLFIPRHTNNHRAKILHNSSIAFLAVGILFLGLVAPTVSRKAPSVLGVFYSISADDLLAKVNKVRVDNNLSPLSSNSNLAIAARYKADDMFAKNYWAHFAPDGSTSPWMFIKNSGYEYIYAGENLAKGFTDSDSVINAWMNSPSHRENILSPRFKDMGFSISEGKLEGEETVLVVQMFGAVVVPAPAAVAPTPIPQELKKTEVKVAVSAPEFVSEVVPQAQKEASIQSKVVNSPVIDLKQASRALSLIMLSFLLGAFVFDYAITKRKELPRLVGHNLDHIMLIAIFLFFIILQRGGGIL